MKRALFVLLAVCAAGAPEISKAGLFDSEGPWGMWGRRCQGEPMRVHANGGGWVSAHASVQESTRIMAGAVVCGGATLGPFVTIGPQARIQGNVTVRDDSYVNAVVRGRVTIAGRSHVDTDNLIVGRAWGEGVSIVNSTVTGSAAISDGARLTHMDVAGGFEARGSTELCHIPGRLTSGSYRGGVHGDRCDSAAPSQTPMVYREGDPYGSPYGAFSQDHYAQAWAQYYAQQRHYYSDPGTCMQSAWDPSRGVWGCQSGTGSAYGHAHNYSYGYPYDGGHQSYQQLQQQGYWQRPGAWDHYYHHQQWAQAGGWQQPGYSYSRRQYELQWYEYQRSVYPAGVAN